MLSELATPNLNAAYLDESAVSQLKASPSQAARQLATPSTRSRQSRFHLLSDRIDKVLDGEKGYLKKCNAVFVNAAMQR